MKKLLRVSVMAALLMPVFGIMTTHSSAEATDETFIEVQKIQMNNQVSTLDVFDDQFITTYRYYADQAAVISAYSKTGALNWTIIEKGPNAITKDKLAIVDRNVLYIYSTVTGKVMATGNYHEIVNFGKVSRVFMNDNYIVLANKQATGNSFFVYDTNGKFIMQGKAEGFKAGMLNNTSFVFQDSKGIHSIDLITKQKMWHVPLASHMSTQHTFVPDDSVIYAQGIEGTDPLRVKDVLVAINPSNGKILYKKDVGKDQEVRVGVKDFGLLTSDDEKELHNFHYFDGSVKMSLNMDSPAIKQQKQKNNIQWDRYNFVQDLIASKDGLYYFKQYSGVHNEYVFSTIKSLSDSGTVKFEKVFDEHVFDIATTSSDKLFVAKRKAINDSGEQNELQVYDSTGNLLDRVDAGDIEHLQSDGSSIYGYGGSTLYIFKETEPRKDLVAPSVPTIDALSNADGLMRGKAEKGATVYATVGGNLIGQTTALWGTVTISIPKQAAGTLVDVYAMDKAGNKSAKKTIKVIDKIAPSVPSVNAIGDNAIAVSGKAESGAKVYAYVGSKKLGEAVAKNGSYSIQIAKQKTGTAITVYAVDPAKNKSGSKTVKVVDKTAPGVPTVNKVTSKSTAVYGKGEKSATVLIYNGSKKIGQGTVDSKGNFKVKISPQKKGSYLKVKLQDNAGNKSGSKTVKVS